jgi:hypothetical protein
MSKFAPPLGMFGSAYRTKSNPCLSCGKKIDAGSAIGTDLSPRPNTYCCCMYCGHVQAWTGDLTFRELRPVELTLLKSQPSWRVVEEVKKLARERKQ